MCTTESWYECIWPLIKGKGLAAFRHNMNGSFSDVIKLSFIVNYFFHSGKITTRLSNNDSVYFLS